MLAVIALVAAGAWLIFPKVEGVFLINPWLNGFILFIFLLGILACLWQVAQAMYSVRWIGAFVAQAPGFNYATAPRLLAPLAALLRSHGGDRQISGSSRTSILDSVATRIDEARDITRYLSNLLIFLGLLGTFYGLATTIPGVVETIKNLAPKEGQSAVEVFENLMSSLETQLGGLGTAFSSSLLGLTGSLVVGLLELFAGHGQNRFYRELEEWLSSITRLGLSSGEGEAAGDDSALVGVLDQIAARLEQGQIRADADRSAIAQGLEALAKGLQDMAARDIGVATLARLTDAQERLAVTQQHQLHALERILVAVSEDSALGADAEARMRLRSIDTQMLRLLEEMTAGRQESLADLRGDLAMLTRTLAQATGQDDGR